MDGTVLITVANGATTITAGNIETLATVPFIPVTLPNVPAGVQEGLWIYAQDTGTVNSMVASISPLPQTLQAGFGVRIKAAFANTGAATLSLNQFGSFPIHLANGVPLTSGDYAASQVVDLVFDGTAWQMTNFAGATSRGGTLP